MNKILWYLTNKLDASSPSFFFLFSFSDSLCCYAAVMWLVCELNLKSQVIWREGEPEIQSYLFLFCYKYPLVSLLLRVWSLGQQPGHAQGPLEMQTLRPRLLGSESGSEQDLQVTCVHAELGDTIAFVLVCLPQFPNTSGPISGGGPTLR